MQPFNAGYVWKNESNMIFGDPSITRQNSFTGSITQQATSVVTKTDPNCYELEQGCFSIYAFEVSAPFWSFTYSVPYVDFRCSTNLVAICADLFGDASR